MAITWLDSKNATKVIHYKAATTTYTTRTITGDDLFDNDAGVGDFIAFQAPPAWKDLTLSISTALVADAITLVWEYNRAQTGNWTTLTVVDGTRNLQDTGTKTVVFDPPDNWRDAWSTIFAGATAGQPMIRCRITAVTNITEGGAFNATPTCGKNIVTVSDYTSAVPCRLSDVYAADLAGERILAPALTCTTGMTITRIYPAENRGERIQFVLSGTSAGAGDTIDITGTGVNDEALTESIDVSSGDGTYTSAYSYKTITSFNCTGWSDGTVQVKQGKWGIVHRLGEADSFYTPWRMYMVDRAQFVVSAGAYFKQYEELLIVNKSGHDRGALCNFAGNADLDYSVVVIDNRAGGQSSENVGGWGGFTTGTDLADSAYILLKAPTQSNYFNLSLGAIVNRSMLGGPGNVMYQNTTGSGVPTLTNSVLGFSTAWQSGSDPSDIVDYGGAVLRGQLYLVIGSGVTFRNLTCDSVAHQYQTSKSYNLVNVTANTWPTTIAGAGSIIRRKYTFTVKVINSTGTAIEGATVSMVDKNGTAVFSTTTDASGDIAVQDVIYTIIGNTETTEYSPHTVTISATGYQTKTMVLTMDRKREEIVVLEKAVDMIIPLGEEVYINLDKANAQNKIMWTK